MHTCTYVEAAEQVITRRAPPAMHAEIHRRDGKGDVVVVVKPEKLLFLFTLPFDGEILVAEECREYFWTAHAPTSRPDYLPSIILIFPRNMDLPQQEMLETSEFLLEDQLHVTSVFRLHQTAAEESLPAP